MGFGVDGKRGTQIVSIQLGRPKAQDTLGGAGNQ